MSIKVICQQNYKNVKLLLFFLLFLGFYVLRRFQEDYITTKVLPSIHRTFNKLKALTLLSLGWAEKQPDVNSLTVTRRGAGQTIQVHSTSNAIQRLAKTLSSMDCRELKVHGNWAVVGNPKLLTCNTDKASVALLLL